MAAINDSVFDAGLQTITTNGDVMHITSVDPGTTYATVTGNTLGNDTITTGSPADASAGTGRSVTTSAITAGNVTGDGTATHWALTDGTSTVYASGALSASQSVTSGNTFTLDAVEIIIRDATAV